MTPNSDLKGLPSLDVEYLINDTRYIYGYHKPLIESDMWSVELCHRQ